MGVQAAEEAFDPIDLGTLKTLYWTSGSSTGSTQRARYTVLLWRTKMLQRGSAVRVSSRIRGVDGTHVGKTRVFVSA